jgi:hypothetical protein
MNMALEKTKSDIQYVCDERYETLQNYTIDDIKKIADTLNVAGSLNLPKKSLCRKISDHVNVVELKSTIEKQLLVCKQSIKKYQNTQYLQKLGETSASKLLPILVQQTLWLLDRHNEYEVLLKENNIQKLIELSATIKTQCNKVESNFDSFIGQPKHKWSLF